MKARLSKTTLTASILIMLAMATTQSCSSDEAEENTSSSSGGGDSSGGGGSSSSGDGTDSQDFSGNKGSFKDERDNKTYKWTKIGNQIWMAQNLNYAGDETELGVCYEGASANCTKYGRLYDWATATSGICPPGWKLPNEDDWKTLTDFVKDDMNCAYCEGTALKAKSGWNDYEDYGIKSGNGTDDYGFSALPGGMGELGDDDYYSAGTIGNWWNSTTEYDGDPIYWYMYNESKTVGRTSARKTIQYSVRCVKGVN